MARGLSNSLKAFFPLTGASFPRYCSGFRRSPFFFLPPTVSSPFCVLTTGAESLCLAGNCHPASPNRGGLFSRFIRSPQRNPRQANWAFRTPPPRPAAPFPTRAFRWSESWSCDGLASPPPPPQHLKGPSAALLFFIRTLASRTTSAVSYQSFPSADK